MLQVPIPIQVSWPMSFGIPTLPTGIHCFHRTNQGPHTVFSSIRHSFNSACLAIVWTLDQGRWGQYWMAIIAMKPVWGHMFHHQPSGMIYLQLWFASSSIARFHVVSVWTCDNPVRRHAKEHRKTPGVPDGIHLSLDVSPSYSLHLQ